VPDRLPLTLCDRATPSTAGSGAAGIFYDGAAPLTQRNVAQAVALCTIRCHALLPGTAAMKAWIALICSATCLQGRLSMLMARTLAKQAADTVYALSEVNATQL